MKQDVQKMKMDPPVPGGGGLTRGWSRERDPRQLGEGSVSSDDRLHSRRGSRKSVIRGYARAGLSVSILEPAVHPGSDSLEHKRLNRESITSRRAWRMEAGNWSEGVHSTHRLNRALRGFF
ncbi:hypothetical protein CEXT_672101 [Caerostris extrusa]|uniref:Uncharacterized protein n=1 Tax=Caerostris extrusa TaxID=172846 RepID=A0AAV4RKU9_CAEEX|nr:hypothetical protein CEXT_672101 [Caerostris extrusa]